MADAALTRLLHEGPAAWNAWREQEPIRSIHADLGGVDLSGLALPGVDLSLANLVGAKLRGVDLSQAKLGRAYLIDADLRDAELIRADLTEAALVRANLSGARLRWAHLMTASLEGADLRGADLMGSHLFGVNLSGAMLCRANLTATVLLESNLSGADLSDATIYGMSAWNLNLDRTIQQGLVVTDSHESTVTVDSVEIGQFIHLILSNGRIRDALDVISSKMVLILRRFREDRKAVLDTLKHELRSRGWVAVLFDFERPRRKDLTGTITTLANLARFVIADLTDPSSVSHELASIVPNTVVPVQPIILDGQREYAMFKDLRDRYHWVLEPVRYRAVDQLLRNLGEQVIAPAELKARELRAG